MKRFAALLLTAAAPVSDGRVIATFDSIDGWQAQGSDGVSASIRPVPGAVGQALRLEYDFHRVSGYAFAHAAVPVAFDGNYELRFRIRGSGGVNDLQLKFVDASGENVWWYQKKDFRPSPEWQTIIVPRDALRFAWGPSEDKTLRRTASIELVVVRGREGGAGHVEIDDLRIAPLPDTPAQLPPPRATDARAIDGDGATAAGLSASRPLLIDFGGARRLGGAVLRWQAQPTREYRVEGHNVRGDGAPECDLGASACAQGWRTLARVAPDGAATRPLAFGAVEADAIRIVPTGGTGRIAEVELMPQGWGETPTAMVSALAEAAPRGTYPRGFTEQSYWTIVGPDAGSDSGLIGEDGAIEVAKGGFSIEPFVLADGKRFGWADVQATQRLEDGYLPIPHVQWRATGWSLDTSLFASPEGVLHARYRLTNGGATARTMRLVLALRPYQVNPPAQFLSQQGGVSPISAIAPAVGGLWVERPTSADPTKRERRAIQLPQTPTALLQGRFDSVDFAHWRRRDRARIVDPTDMATAAIVYDVTLKPGESREIPVAVPLAPLPAGGADAAIPMAEPVEQAHARTAGYWRQALNHVAFRVPARHQRVPDTIRTATAHMLMSRAGPMLKPGTRSYNRSWIRDGAMIADGLLRLGLDQPAIDYADWYSNYLFANGKVPCCVDFRGADPVPENDSHGEYIHLLVQLYRYTGDRNRLDRQWPHLIAAWNYMEGLRQSERTPDNPAWTYGLMPPSISHEGYSAKAQYSLWDDFWALRGYKDAAFAARTLGKTEAGAIAAARDEFQHDLHAAIRASVAHWGIDFVPGATSLGDFDATSTTMAFDPAGEAARLDPQWLRNTFERQWQRVQSRRTPGADWKDYTPYELRNVSAFARLGWRERAQALLDFYFADQRPQGWNQWAEVVGRDPREIRFIGDMPHAWVASDYVRSALDLFAYERQDDQAIVLGAGLTESYLTDGGSSVAGLRTTFGTLDFAMRIDGDTLVARIGGTAAPPGGFVLPWPLATPPGSVTIDGKPARFAEDGLHIPANGRPVDIRIAR